MAALSSLLAMWVNADEQRIGASLADSLMRVLDLDGVRVAFSTGPGETLEVSRLPKDVHPHLAGLLDFAFPEPGGWAGLRARCRRRTARILHRHRVTGTGPRAPRCAVASSKLPGPGEHLALTLAANQVAWLCSEPARNAFLERRPTGARY